MSSVERCFFVFKFETWDCLFQVNFSEDKKLIEDAFIGGPVCLNRWCAFYKKLV